MSGHDNDSHESHHHRRYPRLTEEGKRKHLDELAYMANNGFLRLHPSDPVTGNPDPPPPEPDGPTGPYLRPAT
jgi:hypothetical protein